MSWARGAFDTFDAYLTALGWGRCACGGRTRNAAACALGVEIVAASEEANAHMAVAYAQPDTNLRLEMARVTAAALLMTLVNEGVAHCAQPRVSYLRGRLMAHVRVAPGGARSDTAL